MPVGLSPEEKLKQSQEAEYKQWMNDHPEIVIAPENLKECGPEIEEFTKMVDGFESEHSLAELFLIIDLAPAEAPNHPIREPARIALGPIVAKLNLIKNETNISSEKYSELRARQKYLSQAVGMINKNKVRHD